GIELDTAGFHLLRSIDDDRDHAVRITTDLIRATGGMDGDSYTFVDKDVQPGIRYAYWLEEVLDDGTINITGPIYGIFIPPGTEQFIYLPLIVR
ncbi:MAG: hypothetical protein NT075_30550, partial [Chloroflexi bacterium]|nr:hypothetical protein [Chloroflexota bacterium]